MQFVGNTLDLSITLVSTNQLRLVEKYLNSALSLKDHSSFEIMLIDNACTDGTASWVRRNLPQVKVITNQKRMSYSANMNLGMQLLQRGRFFVVLNPDIKCLPGLFDEAVAFMDTYPNVGLMGPQLLNPDGSIQYSCRHFSRPLSLLIRGLHLDRVLKNTTCVRKYLMTDFDHAKVIDIDWVTGALMVVRREAIDQVGGMDERYELTYSDDQDWCCRMWHGGWRVCYVPQAKAIHDHQRTGMRNPFAKMGRIQTLNAIRMFHKFGWRLERQPRSNLTSINTQP